MPDAHADRRSQRPGRPPASQSTGDVTALLHYRAPYDWDGVLAFLQARAIPGVEAITAGRYARTIAMDGVHGMVIVEPTASDALKATVRFPRLSLLPEITARLRRLFDLEADPEAIATRLAGDALLAPLVSARPGLRVPGSWDGFELAVRAVLGQQISVKAAVGLAAKLVVAHGKRVSLPNVAVEGLTHLFPGPERLASADAGTLGMPVRRAQTLTSLAAAVASDPELLSAGGDTAECVKRLRALGGIGEWTAQYIAMRALREPDAFPADDVGLKRALADRGGRRPTSRDILARAERWRPWRAYAAQHLWASLAARKA